MDAAGEERYCEIEGCGLPVRPGEGIVCAGCGRLVCDYCPTARTGEGSLCADCAEAVGIILPHG